MLQDVWDKTNLNFRLSTNIHKHKTNFSELPNAQIAGNYGWQMAF